MGQAAAVDLPDPLESPPVSPASTDDLLAQLAGEEIERLLSESDDEGAPAAAAPSAPTSAKSTPKSPAPSQSVAPVASLLEAPDATAATPHAGAKPGGVVDAELDALFSQLDTAGAGAGASKTNVSTGSDAAAPAAAQNGSTVPTADAEPSAAEALAQEMAEDAALNSAGPRSLNADAADVENLAAVRASGRSSAPIYLRLLAWLNAPLDSFPDHVRDLVGKIAILTTVNALSVLLYVLFFRHH